MWIERNERLLKSRKELRIKSDFDQKDFFFYFIQFEFEKTVLPSCFYFVSFVDFIYC